MNYSKESEDWTIKNTIYPQSVQETIATKLEGEELNFKPFGNEEIPVPDSALNVQVGGHHYSDFNVQPIEFITKNNIPFIEGCCIKYLCRHKGKGKAEDIKKVIHYCNILLELEYGEKDSKSKG